jgi:hypothetical protein
MIAILRQETSFIVCQVVKRQESPNLIIDCIAYQPDGILAETEK